MSKYIDLAGRIWDEVGIIDGGFVQKTLNWLDRNSDQVPGRTITESEYITIRDEHVSTGAVRSAIAFFTVATDLGITVIPDPEPTNAEKLAAQIRLTLIVNSTGTCRSEQDVAAERIAADLDAAGVKAPDHD